jgi:hypothetical protein
MFYIKASSWQLWVVLVSLLPFCAAHLRQEHACLHQTFVTRQQQLDQGGVVGQQMCDSLGVIIWHV